MVSLVERLRSTSILEDPDGQHERMALIEAAMPSTPLLRASVKGKTSIATTVANNFSSYNSWRTLFPILHGSKLEQAIDGSGMYHIIPAEFHLSTQGVPGKVADIILNPLFAGLAGAVVVPLLIAAVGGESEASENQLLSYAVQSSIGFVFSAFSLGVAGVMSRKSHRDAAVKEAAYAEAAVREYVAFTPI